MNITINVQGLDTVMRNLDDLARQQMPFATAKALTNTAQDVQQEVLQGLPNRFTLRTGWANPRTPYGFKIEKATKQNLTAKVFTKAPWMQLQESGGVKTANGKRLAIPFLYHSALKPGVVFGAKRTKRDLIAKKDLPKNLGPGTFQLKAKSGNVLLAQRTGKGKRSILRILYSLEPSGKIKPRLGFAQTAQQVVDKRYLINLAAALDYAIRTAGFKK